MTDRRWAPVVAATAGLGLVLVLVLVMAGRPGTQVASSPSPTVAGSTGSPVPTTTPTASPLATTPAATAAPATTAVATAGTAPRTAEEAARQLAMALEASDFVRLRALVVPDGWVAGFFRAEGTEQMTPDETVAWLRERAPDGRIRADVAESPVLTPAGPMGDARRPHPRGDRYIRSVWTDFGDTTGDQNVHLMLEEVNGRWYWSGALFGAPD